MFTTDNAQCVDDPRLVNKTTGVQRPRMCERACVRVCVYVFNSSAVQRISSKTIIL